MDRLRDFLLHVIGKAPQTPLSNPCFLEIDGEFVLLNPTPEEVLKYGMNDSYFCGFGSSIEWDVHAL